MITLMVFIVLVGLGLILGSFVNAVVWRVYEQDKISEKKRPSKADRQRLQRLSIAKGRSMCLSCGHELSAIDLIPVASWLWLRGKCRYCQARIPDTPVAELLVPALLVVSYVFWPLQLSTGLDWLIFGLWGVTIVGFVALTLYDLRWYLLPNRIVFPLMVVALLFRFALTLQANFDKVGVFAGGFWGVLILSGLFYALFVISKEQWIGGGDVKLAVVLGLLAGGPLVALLLLFIASISGTLAAVPLLVRGKSIRHMRIPFGPFLILATIVTVLFGQGIIDWYIGLFAASNQL